MRERDIIVFIFHDIKLKANKKLKIEQQREIKVEGFCDGEGMVWLVIMMMVNYLLFLYKETKWEWYIVTPKSSYAVSFQEQ